MQADNFELQSYLSRIGYQGEAKVNMATVTSMMRCQLFSVPFENLDVQAGKVVSMVPEEIVEKILGRNRGGFCFELNGLFAMALQALGIPYQFVAARPMLYPEKRPKTHMAIVLSMNGEKWLCDLGFGSYGIRAPMRLSQLDVEVKQDNDSFMLSKNSDGELVLKALVEGVWANQFAFDLSAQDWVDFVPANYFSCTHPEAIFVRKLIIVLHNPAGRKIFSGHTLKIVENGKVEVQTVAPEDINSVLLNQFGLVWEI
jgi:N-hydroxyarylamine O-acetyltransferase